jgi:hypothetical protein
MKSCARNGSFLLVCFIMTFVCLIPGKSFAVYPPEWLQAHTSGSLKMPKEYYGAGFTEYKGEIPGYEELRLAKDRALDELCYQLSVSLQSKFEDRIIKKGDYEEQQIASSLFISTRKVLSGVQEKDKWTDNRKHRHWVLLVIDKDKADQQIEQQKFINEVVDRLEHKQDEVLEGIKQMASVLETNMQVYQDRMNQLEGLLKTIDTKVEASGAQTKEAYAYLRKDIKQLEKSRKAYEDTLAQSEKRQSRQIEALIAQNKELKALMSQLSEKIQDDYFLALANDDIQYKNADTDFRVNIRPDKGQGADYYDGEKVRFLVEASKGCYVKVIYISNENEGSKEEKKINIMLFPNEHDTDNWIDAGETKVIGRLGELEIQPPFGKDIVTVVASERQFSDIAGLIQGAQGGYYTEVTSTTRGALEVRTRGIQVVRPESGTAGEAVDAQMQRVSVATDTCFIASRPR